MNITNKCRMLPLCIALATISQAWAQTPHDNPCGAINLSVIESADAPQDNRISFNGATYTAYSITDVNPCNTNFSYATDPDFWYKFVATTATVRIAIATAQGGNSGCNINYGISANEFSVLTGPCSGPFNRIACGRSDIPSSTLLSNLTVGTTYYIKISSGFGYTCGTLSCQVYTETPAATARVGMNTTQPQANFDVAGTAFFRNNVGLGTSAPTARLHVQGSLRLADGTEGNGKVLTSNTDGVATWQALPAPPVTFWSQNGNHISTTNSGNVGIGTSTPVSYGDLGRALQIESAGNGYNLGSSLVLSFNSAGTNWGNVGALNFVQSNATSADKRVGIIQSSLETSPFFGSLGAPKGRLDFYVNDGAGSFNALAINSRGNIGIGNNRPLAPLHFATDTRNRKIVLWSVEDNDHRFYGLGINPFVQRYQVPATTDGHVFYAGTSATTSNELFRVQGNGNVGINQSNPQVPLHFATALGKKISLYRGPLGDAGFGVWGNELRIHSDYNGADITFGFDDFTNGFTERFRVRANGNATLAGVLTQNSDETLKKNIEPIANASHLLQQLHGYRYQWKDANADADKQLGLLAQEVQKVLPELVKEGDNGNLGVNYSGLIPVLLEALKEQQMRIAELEKKLEKILSK